MERAEISLHQARIYQCLVQAQGWMTNKELAQATGVSLRRTSHHTKAFVALGILDQAETYPGHRYRLSAMAKKRNHAYVLRLEQATEIFRDMLIPTTTKESL